MASDTIVRVEIRKAQRAVLIDGQAADLGARAFDVLLALVERRDRIVSRDELLDIVWPGLVVEENNLSVQVWALRRILGSKAITTIPGRGYRLTLASYAIVDAVMEADSTDAPPADAAPARSLPAPETEPLIGRHAEASALAALLARQRLTTVVGVAGVGKTRLAQAVVRGLAHPLPIYWIDLAPLGDPTLLALSVAHTVGIALDDRSAPLQGLVAALAAQPSLLVLDNCEHMVEAVGEFCRCLLASAAGPRVLAISQCPLGVAGERVFRLAPLAVSPTRDATPGADCAALSLLEERVKALDHLFRIDERNRGVALELCRRLDGLPLAIELAASRVPLLGVQGVLDRLGERFKLLTARARAGPPRRNALRAAIEWSHGLLGPRERTVFRRLAVFGGSFTMESAQQVARDETMDDWAVLEAVGRLVDRCLVQPEGHGRRRLRLLESLRAFALEELQDRDDAAACRRRHAEHFACFFDALADALYGDALSEERYIQIRDDELGNLREALNVSTGEGGDIAIGLRLMVAAAPMSNLLPFRSQAIRWWRALQQRLTMPHSARRAAQCRYVWLHWGQGAWWQADQWPDEGFAAASAIDALADPRRCAHALYLQALLASNAGDRAAADLALEKAARLEAPDWPAWLLTRRTLFRASFDRERGRATTSHLAALNDGLAALQRAGAGQGRWAFRIRCFIAAEGLHHGRAAEAAQQLSGLAEWGRRNGVDSAGMSSVLASLVLAHLAHGQLDEARSAAQEAVRQLARSGLWPRLGHAILLTAVRLGQFAAAARMLGILDVHVARNGLRPSAAMQRARDDSAAALQLAIGTGSLEVWQAEGKAQSGATFLRLALDACAGRARR